MDRIAQLEAEIRSLKTQGATAVAEAVLEGLSSLVASKEADKSYASLHKVGQRLAYARPTEPLAQNALRYVLAEANQPAAHYLQKIAEYQELIQKAKQAIATFGIPLIVDGGSYLTHCHSSTAVNLLITARKRGVNFAVYVTETRPLFQGRTTATELLAAGFGEVIMIVDDVAYSIIEGEKGALDAIFIGADLLSEKGFVNKVGSLTIVRAAERANIPVYCLTTLLKFDPRPFSPTLIEERSGTEIWPDAPAGVTFYAPAFDFVPYTDNVKLITESGIIVGSQVKQVAQTLYPFIKEG